MAEWKYPLNVSDFWNNDELSLHMKALELSRRVKVKSWYDESNYNGDLESLLEELVDAGEDDNVQWFNEALSAIYDIFDAGRIWMRTS